MSWQGGSVERNPPSADSELAIREAWLEGDCEGWAHTAEPGNRPPRPSQRVDEACDRLDSAWRGSRAPQIERTQETTLLDAENAQ